ncbi:trafficking protein particle complex subunit 2-like protein isoform X2 [Saccopteryx leptura]|uniref:trafficking protein particle complex subunit 2-like protein isoform X2 n=1 Tax=Saccopteryx leptura TaxID=249018 RepID=UPI00339BBDB7
MAVCVAVIAKEGPEGMGTPASRSRWRHGGSGRHRPHPLLQLRKRHPGRPPDGPPLPPGPARAPASTHPPNPSSSRVSAHFICSTAQFRRPRHCPLIRATEDIHQSCVPTENELKFHYMVHTSLDVVDEKISAMGKTLVDQRELYLGLLYPTEDYKVYGYVTNSKVKFVMVVDSSNTALRDNEIRSMFRKLHNSYTDVMCNPFYNPGDHIQSRAFDNMVTSMMMQVC